MTTPHVVGRSGRVLFGRMMHSNPLAVTYRQTINIYNRYIGYNMSTAGASEYV